MHSLEELREMLRGRTWRSLLGVVLLDNGLYCRARLGCHMGRSVCAVIIENQFVAIKRLDMYPMFSLLTLPVVPDGMVTWDFDAAPAPDELIIKDTDYETTQDRDLLTGAAAFASCT